VDKSGEGEYTSIQMAIDNATDGDTVVVTCGTYYETLWVNKSISLIGEGQNLTILNYHETLATQNKVLIRIFNDSCSIEGVHLIGLGTNADTTGIQIHSSNNIITNTTISNCELALHLYDLSQNNRIAYTTFSENKRGISCDYAEGNILCHNFFSGCTTDGIYLHQSNTNEIFENNFSQNGMGIHIKGSDENEVFDNSFYQNKRGILCCCGSGHNIIYHNSFRKNSEYHARDDIRNNWDNGKVGNYWDDYSSTYSNATAMNGIWDTPYEIYTPHTTEIIQDHYPLVTFTET
jgi:parallel beta-helix repeat protein